MLLKENKVQSVYKRTYIKGPVELCCSIILLCRYVEPLKLSDQMSTVKCQIIIKSSSVVLVVLLVIFTFTIF
jgi:hypothetical protein